MNRTAAGVGGIPAGIGRRHRGQANDRPTHPEGYGQEADATDVVRGPGNRDKGPPAGTVLDQPAGPGSESVPAC